MNARTLEALASLGCLITAPPPSTVSAGRPPRWVVRPTTEAQLSAAVRVLGRDGIRWRVDAQGRNWGYDDSRVVDEPIIVRLSELRELAVDQELGVVTVQPGVTFGDVLQALAQQRQWWLPEPGSGPHTSVMGNALARGYLDALGEREACTRDVTVMDREDGSVSRWDWSGPVDERVRRAFAYPAGPHRRGELFQRNGQGPLVVRMAHTLAVRPAWCSWMAVLCDGAADPATLDFWRAALHRELVVDTVLQSRERRRLQGFTGTHAGSTLRLTVVAPSKESLRSRLVDVQRLGREHRVRLRIDATTPPDDMMMLGATSADPAGVGSSTRGMEWRTMAVPFDRALVVAVVEALGREPALSTVGWTLRALDIRSLVWIAPLLFDKADAASRTRMREAAAAIVRVQDAFGLPEHRSAAVRS